MSEFYLRTPVRTLLMSLIVVWGLAVPFVSFMALFSVNTFCSSREADARNSGKDAVLDGCVGERLEFTLRRLATFSSVAAIGAFGAAVGFATRRDVSLSRNTKQVGATPSGSVTVPSPAHETVPDWRGSLLELTLVQFVGASFAIALSFVFFGGLVGGSLFPTQGPLHIMTNGSEIEFFKLMTWSFIAGFSQRTVPDVIANLLRRAKTEDVERKEEPSPNLPRPS